MKIGIIGGSGLYDLNGLNHLQENRIETPFGPPSDVLLSGEIDGAAVVFLPRHGRGHQLMPSEINHRANLYAMKSLGVEKIISVSAVGSFREEMAPGHVVLIDQFVDRTKNNADHTFFGEGIVAHIAFAQPTCPALRRIIQQEAEALVEAEGLSDEVTIHSGGTYLNMAGPAFSTLAESRLYQSWGMDVIGMTNLAEAKLAREAEICYLTMAMVTDYDCWHADHESVSVEMVIQRLLHNVVLARKIILCALPKIARTTDDGSCSCRTALANAIITRPEAVSKQIRQKLAPIVGKYLPVN